MFFILMPLSGLLNDFMVGLIYPKNTNSSQKFATNILPNNLNKPPVRLKKHNMRKCAILDFGFFLLWFQFLFFHFEVFSCAKKSNERGIFSPLVTSTSVKNFTGMMIEIEKINQPFMTKFSECALTHCFAKSLCRKRLIFQKLSLFEKFCS